MEFVQLYVPAGKFSKKTLVQKAKDELKKQTGETATTCTYRKNFVIYNSERNVTEIVDYVEVQGH